MLTATQLIRQAALATGPIEVKPGKVITWVDPPLEPTTDTYCWLCGGEIEGHGLPTKRGIKDTFTDNPWARGHGSTSLCPGCAFCLGNRQLRNYSLLATAHELRHPSRAEWKDILFNPPEPPFVACLAVSGQKHLSFKGIVSLNREVFTVMLEEQAIEVVPSQLAACLDAVEAAYAWFTKDEITSGRYSQHRVRQCGLARWEELEAALEPWRGSRLFGLALFVAQKPEGQPAQETVVNPDAVPTTSAIGRQRANEATGQLRFDWR